jgi:adenosyl cobinamide kinase/adenosyl cobinamide phosphate guanylyltransferase
VLAATGSIIVAEPPFAKIHENTVHIDDRMWSQFEKVNKTAATNYEWLDKRLFIVERDMQTRIQAHDERRADLTETVHLGNLQEDLTQVNATVESLVANQTGVSKALSFARRADEHVNEQGKMFQSFDSKLEAQAQLLEELQMKIIVSNEEVQAQIASCKETTHAWDKRLSKFDMTLFANESNNYGCSLWYQFVRNPSETAEAGGRVPPLELVR